MPLIKIFEVSGAALLPGGTTTTITSTDTFVAGDAGVYRVLLVGGGGSGRSQASPTDCPGAGTGFPQYFEVSLTASENVSVTIGAGGALAGTAEGNPGGRTTFGSYASTYGGRPSSDATNGGDGWAGGGIAGQAGGALGSDGGGAAGGKGLGTELPTFYASRFTGVTLSAGVAGAASSGGDAGGGGAGLLIDAAGPAGTSATTTNGGRGSGYGGGSGGASGAVSNPGNPGVVIVEGPYSA